MAQGRSRGRLAVWWTGFGLAVVAIAVTALVVSGLVGGAAPPPLARYEHVFPDEYVEKVWFTLGDDDEATETHDVTVAWGRLSTRLSVSAPVAPAYTVTKGAGNGIRTEPLVVSVDPGVPVTFGYGVPPAGAVDLSAKPWEAAPYSSGVPTSEPAVTDGATGRAAVDESVSYGGFVVEGVGVREAPTRESDKIGTVWHGQVHEAECWARGQVTTNGNYADPADDAAAYTSDVWWRVTIPDGTGFVADAWFSRRGNSDRLGLPECA
jgi:hypothetical protein